MYLEIPAEGDATAEPRQRRVGRDAVDGEEGASEAALVVGPRQWMAARGHGVHVSCRRRSVCAASFTGRTAGRSVVGAGRWERGSFSES